MTLERNAIATNDSSIVSKRAAERAGYFQERQFLEYFVSKPQRRAPLIHLGYYIRCCAIDYIIAQAIEKASSSDLAIVNLGCGYDPTFFRLSKKNTRCNLKYIDVDYPDLIEIKKRIVSEEAANLSIVPCLDHAAGGFQAVNVNNGKTHTYHLVPRNLSNTSGLIEDLYELGISTLPILFVSEVSTVYMDSTEATNLFKSLSIKFPKSSLCVLEQVLPQYHSGGSAYQHMMLNHFEKNVHTPLHGAISYPTLEDKTNHIYNSCSNWNIVPASTLERIWKDAVFEDERKRVSKIEPFDEWEEIDLFLKHYCVLLATSTESQLNDISKSSVFSRDSYSQSHNEERLVTPPVLLSHNISTRKEEGTGDVIGTNGSSLSISRRGHSVTYIGSNRVLVFGGFGKPLVKSTQLVDFGPSHKKDTRLSHSELLVLDSNVSDRGPLIIKAESASKDPGVEPCPRLYHSAVVFKEGINSVESSVVIFGGRKGPTELMNDLFIYDIKSRSYAEITCREKIPQSRYRHAACAIGSSLMLIQGGIGRQGEVLSDSWIFDLIKLEWTPVSLMDPTPSHVFDNPCHSHQLISIVSTRDDYSTDAYDIYRFGGIDADGQYKNPWSAQLRVQRNNGGDQDLTKVSISVSNSGDISDLSDSERFHLQRYGAAASLLHDKRSGIKHRWWVLMTGGITKAEEQSKSDLILIQLQKANNKRGLSDIRGVRWSEKMRLWIGHSTCPVGDYSQILLTGGGGTCFSFGSLVDGQTVLLRSPFNGIPETGKPLSVRTGKSSIKYVSSLNSLLPAPSPTAYPSPQGRRWGKPISCKPVSRVRNPNREIWREIVKKQEPVVLENLDLGPCLTQWTPKYLKDKCGDIKVSVHVKPPTQSKVQNDSGNEQAGVASSEFGREGLTWHNRNFSYQIMSMKDFLDRVYGDHPSEGTVYLRSLSAKARKPALLEADFPGIADDLVIPEALRDELVDAVFSSVLRISSSSFGIWPHYDVYDNVLMQISGAKRVRVWNPREADRLYIKGSSSEIGSGSGFVEDPDFPLIQDTNPVEAELKAGDAIFIPACWVHSVQGEGPSVGVNTFFGEGGGKKDVWGNADGPEEARAREMALSAVRTELNALAPGRRAMYTHKVAQAISALARDDTLWTA